MAGFAATSDRTAQAFSCHRSGLGLYAYIAENELDSGGIAGPGDGRVVDARSAPAMAQGRMACIAEANNLELHQPVLSHGAGARGRGVFRDPVQSILCTRTTRDLAAACHLAMWRALEDKGGTQSGEIAR